MRYGFHCDAVGYARAGACKGGVAAGKLHGHVNRTFEALMIPNRHLPFAMLPVDCNTALAKRTLQT